METDLTEVAQAVDGHEQCLAHHHQILGELTAALRNIERTLAEIPSGLTTDQYTALSTPPVPAPHTNSPVAMPDRYDGNPSQCKGFLMQVTLYLAAQPGSYPTDQSKVALIVSLLRGRALLWATAVWEGAEAATGTYA